MVGDTLEVVFRNTLEFDTTLTPNGVELAENDTEPVGPSETKTYSWNITERVSSSALSALVHSLLPIFHAFTVLTGVCGALQLSPGANEPSSKLWLYT